MKPTKLTCECVGGKHCDCLWIRDMGDGQVEVNVLVLDKKQTVKKIGNRYLVGGVVVSKKKLTSILKTIDK